MASGVRVLPAVIAVSIGALAFKGVGLAEAIAEAVDANAPEEEAAPPETALTAGADVGEAASGEDAADPAAGAVRCLPSVDYATEMGVSEQEIHVLRSLADRRVQLDQRETDIVQREQVAAAAEERLNEQITQLKKLETEVNTALAAMDAKRDERMAALVKTYEAMKPKDAARIFNGMDGDVLLDLAKSMKPANLAAVMAAMDAKNAEALTRRLAALAQPPASVEALRPAASGGSPAPTPVSADKPMDPPARPAEAG
ncbi:MAG: hypothetical protein R3C52_07160 [Hyphomonadaceae bacterium]